MWIYPGDEQRLQGYYNAPGSNFTPAQPGNTMKIDPRFTVFQGGLYNGTVRPEHYMGPAPPGVPDTPPLEQPYWPGLNRTADQRIYGRVYTDPSQITPSPADDPILTSLRQQGSNIPRINSPITPTIFNGPWDVNPLATYRPAAQRPQPQRPYQPNYNQVPGQMGNSPGASSSILDLIGKLFGGQQSQNYLNPYTYNPPTANYD